MNGHKTAIRRSKLSAPAKFLSDRNMIRGRALDYGSGQGFDADSLGLERFDPHYSPVMPTGSFDTIMCNYVLNVIPDDKTRTDVITSIMKRLRANGIAYITVRNDRASLNGWTKRGTWQGLITLDLPVVTSNRNFTMYRLEK